MPPHIALRVVFDGKGTEFDSKVVDTFIKSLGIYPVGSFVKLSTEEMGVVVEVNPEDPLRPKVGVLFTRFGKQRTSPFPIDLLKEQKEGMPDARSITGADDPRKYGINVEDYIG